MVTATDNKSNRNTETKNSEGWLILVAVALLAFGFYLVAVLPFILGEKWASDNQVLGQKIMASEGVYIQPEEIASATKLFWSAQVSTRGRLYLDPPSPDATLFNVLYSPDAFGGGGETITVVWEFADGSRIGILVTDFCGEFKEATVCLEPTFILINE